MAESIPLVAFDVHQRQSHAAFLRPGTGEVRSQRLDGPPLVVVDYLAELPAGTRAVYEAGPVGFGPARAAAARGLDLRVIAPGLIPRGPADRVKTDRRDAIRLVRLLAAGELTFVRVPSIEEERLRELVRAIEDARKDLMRARHRLSAFCRRRGLRYPGPGVAWTQRHIAWLERLSFDDPCRRAVHIDYLAAVRMIAARREELIGVLERELPNSSYAEPAARLRSFRGIDTLTAAGLCAEVGDFRRFQRPKLLFGYLGLVPSEHTSDERRRQGGITKAGPDHARRLLVEAAHHYRHQPRIGVKLARRQRSVDPRVIEISWRAQRRLHARWRDLAGTRRKPAGKVAVACARELAAFCWEAAVLD